MDLYVQPRAGGQALKLTSGAGDEMLPRWSRDGTRIAYVAARGETSDILLISPLGGPSKKLAETRIPYVYSFWEMNAALGSEPWSPNDVGFLFSRRLNSGDVAIFQVDLGTREEMQVTFPTSGAKDLSASWSFDGEWIVFSRTRGGVSELWLVPGAGGEARPLLLDQFVNLQPAFLSGDQHVVFASNRAAGMENIWSIHIPSGELSQLTFGGGMDTNLAISSDGLMVYSRWSHQTDLHALEVSTGETGQLTSWSLDNFAGRYSPNGDRIAYQSTRTGNSEVWILNLETREELNISAHAALDLLPAWSPNGDELAFLSDRDGAMNLWVTRSDGSGSPERVSDQEIYIPNVVWAVSLGVRWTPDGDSIGYVLPGVEGPALWLVDRVGDTGPRLLRDGVERFDWYMDRNRIVYTILTENGVELRAANLETGEERLLYAGPQTEMILAADGAAIALVKSESHFNQGLFLLRLEPPTTAAGLPTPVGELEQLTDGEGMWHVHNGGWSPDGEHIVYTQDTDNGDVFLLTIEQ